eukprot:gene5714-6606_t
MLRFNQLFETEPDFVVDHARFRQMPSDQLLQETINALKENRFDVQVVENEQEALEFLKSAIPKDVTVMSSGSITIDEIGFKDYATHTKEFDFLYTRIMAENDAVKRDGIRRQAMSADYYIASTSAISKEGHLFIPDATGTRASGFTGAKKKVIVVASANKICESDAEAMARVTEFCLPCESVRSRFAFKAAGAKGSQIQNLFLIIKKILGY